MKRIPIEGWMSLGDLRPNVPWERNLLKGVGVVGEPEIIILISDSMEERAHNIAAYLFTSLLPPNSRFPLLCWNVQAFGMRLCLQPITLTIFQLRLRGRLRASLLGS